MNEHTRNEIEAVKRMVVNWKSSYLGLTQRDGGGEHLVQEFMEEVNTHVYHYLNRLCACQHLSRSETQEIMNFCYEQVEDFRHSLL